MIELICSECKNCNVSYFYFILISWKFNWLQLDFKRTSYTCIIILVLYSLILWRRITSHVIYSIRNGLIYVKFVNPQVKHVLYDIIQDSIKYIFSAYFVSLYICFHSNSALKDCLRHNRISLPLWAVNDSLFLEKILRFNAI